MNPFKRKVDSAGQPVNNTKGQPLFVGAVKLIDAINYSEDRLLTNSNGKRYALANVQYVAVSGEVKTCTASFYEGNFILRKPAVGEELSATVTIAPNKEGKLTPYMQMSHLIAGAGYGDVADFTVEEVAETSAAQVLTGAIKN